MGLSDDRFDVPPSAADEESFPSPPPPAIERDVDSPPPAPWPEKPTRDGPLRPRRLIALGSADNIRSAALIAWPPLAPTAAAAFAADCCCRRSSVR